MINIQKIEMKVKICQICKSSFVPIINEDICNDCRKGNEVFEKKIETIEKIGKKRKNANKNN